MVEVEVTAADNSGNNTEFIFSQDNYRKALLKWIAERDQSVYEPQQTAFSEVVRSLNPFAEEVSPSTLQRDLIEQYEDRAKLVQLKLSEVPGKVSFTITKILLNNHWFLKVQAHWINNWKIESDLLDFCQMQEQENLSNSCDLFVGCLDRFKIPLSKILGITLQNVSDNHPFSDALRNQGIAIDVNISADANFIESLQNIVNSSLQALFSSFSNETELKIGERQSMSSEDETDTNATPIMKLRNLSEAIVGSCELQHELKEMCVLMGVEFSLPLIDKNSVSTLQMIEKAFQLQQPLRALCIKWKTLSKFMVSDAEWKEVDSLQKLVLKFYRAADFVSIHSYLATFNWLVDSVSSVVNQHNDGFLADALKVCLEKLNAYKKKISDSKIPHITTLLNPALKMAYFKEHNYSKSNVKEIEKDVHEIFKKFYEVKGTTTSGDKSENEDELFSHMFKRAKNDKLSKEFQTYLRYPLSSPKCDVLEFWKLNEPEFPCLSRMAQDYLGISSSVLDFKKSEAEESVTTEQIRTTNCLRYWLKSKN